MVPHCRTAAGPAGRRSTRYHSRGVVSGIGGSRLYHGRGTECERWPRVRPL